MAGGAARTVHPIAAQKKMEEIRLMSIPSRPVIFHRRQLDSNAKPAKNHIPVWVPNRNKTLCLNMFSKSQPPGYNGLSGRQTEVRSIHRL
jgi:hypothetical protein